MHFRGGVRAPSDETGVPKNTKRRCSRALVVGSTQLDPCIGFRSKTAV